MWKKLFCRHEHKTCITNIYGDMINDLMCRSVWKCERCDKSFFSDKVEPSCEVVNFTLTHQHEDKGE